MWETYLKSNLTHSQISCYEIAVLLIFLKKLLGRFIVTILYIIFNCELQA